MNQETRKFHADLLKGNVDTCAAIAERLDRERYSENGHNFAAAETVNAILALAEAVRILARVQMYQDYPGHTDA